VENDFLQNIKVEISKSIRLAVYERIALHKVLGIVRSENGCNILLRDLGKKDIIRNSAIRRLRDFDAPLVTDAFIQLLLEDNVQGEERNFLYDHIARCGGEEHSLKLMDYISANLELTDMIPDLVKAMSVLSTLRDSSEKCAPFLQRIAENNSFLNQ
jgi:hypothetical protein